MRYDSGIFIEQSKVNSFTRANQVAQFLVQFKLSTTFSSRLIVDPEVSFYSNYQFIKLIGFFFFLWMLNVFLFIKSNIDGRAKPTLTVVHF